MGHLLKASGKTLKLQGKGASLLFTSAAAGLRIPRAKESTAKTIESMGQDMDDLMKIGEELKTEVIKNAAKKSQRVKDRVRRKFNMSDAQAQEAWEQGEKEQKTKEAKKAADEAAEAASEERKAKEKQEAAKSKKERKKEQASENIDEASEEAQQEAEAAKEKREARERKKKAKAEKEQKKRAARKAGDDSEK